MNQISDFSQAGKIRKLTLSPRKTKKKFTFDFSFAILQFAF